MGIRILIVEDDPDNRESLGLLFETWGYQVELAATGERGIALAATRRPDVVLLDLGLPTMQGEHVAMVMKAMPSPPFIVAYTGYQRLEAEALASGCDAFIVKPSLDKLAALLVTIGLERAARASGDE